MKTVDVAQAVADLASLLAEVEGGEEVVIARDGKPVARLTPPVRFERTPGVAANHPAWKDFKYDPSIFKPLETDEELRDEGWEV